MNQNNSQIPQTLYIHQTDAAAPSVIVESHSCHRHCSVTASASDVPTTGSAAVSHSAADPQSAPVVTLVTSSCTILTCSSCCASAVMLTSATNKRPRTIGHIGRLYLQKILEAMVEPVVSTISLSALVVCHCYTPACTHLCC